MVSKVSEYEIFQHPPYSPDLSPTDYYFFKNSDNFVRNETFRTKSDAVSAFMNFLASQSQDFYRRAINDLLGWQKCIAI